MKLLSPELKETLRLKGKYTFKWFSFFILLLILVFIICYYQGWHHKKKEVKPKYRVNYLPHDWVPPSHLTKEIIEKPIIQYVDRPKEVIPEATKQELEQLKKENSHLKDNPKEVPVEIIKYVNKPVYVDKPVETIKYVDRKVEKIVKVPEIRLMPIDTETINNLKNEINEKKQLITELETKIDNLTTEIEDVIKIDNIEWREAIQLYNAVVRSNNFDQIAFKYFYQTYPKKLLKAGYTLRQLITKLPIMMPILLLNDFITTQDIKACQFTASEFKALNYPLQELFYDVKYTYDELIAIGYTEEELNEAGIFKPNPPQPPKPTPSNDREGDSPFTTTITTII